MPAKFIQAAGNELIDTVIYVAAFPYPIVGANTITTNTVTVLGLQVLDCVSWSVQGLPAHLALENLWVSSANTLTVTWSADSTGVGTAGTVPILMEVVRVDGANLGASVIPPNIAY
jgi:hypothetical protein